MLKQILSVTATSLAGLPQRWGAALVVVVGIAGVVGVMVALLAMAQGFERVFTQAGRADRVIVMRGGDDNGRSSALTRDQVPVVLSAPGFKRGADGKPLASPLKFMTSALPDRETGEELNVLLRGAGGPVAQVWPELRLVEGRWFEPGKRELIAGRAAQRQFAGLGLGKSVELANGPWTVVGVFEAPGAVYESELWGDVEMVFAGYSITGQFSAVVGLLESEAAYTALADAITTNPSLSHVVKREPEYYATQTGVLGTLMLTLGYVVASIMALGALFSAVNTMHASVKARGVEIATLRAIGFSSLPIVLCLAGAAAGGALAWLLFNGFTISTLSGNDLSQVAFAFHVDARLLATAAAWACAIGLLGGLFPALRAARRPVAEALRSG